MITESCVVVLGNIESDKFKKIIETLQSEFDDPRTELQIVQNMANELLELVERNKDKT
jgi:hypothetical protein